MSDHERTHIAPGRFGAWRTILLAALGLVIAGLGAGCPNETVPERPSSVVARPKRADPRVVRRDVLRPPRLRTERVAPRRAAPWYRVLNGLVSELHVDVAREQVLVRTLSFPGKCFHYTWYVEIPAACDKDTGSPKGAKPVRIDLQTYSLANGAKANGRPVVAGRSVKLHQPMGEMVLDYAANGILSRRDRKRELVAHRAGRTFRWKAPAGEEISDARFAKNGRIVLVAHHSTRDTRFLSGTLTLWEPSTGRTLKRHRIRVPQKSYPRPRRHFRYRSMGVMSISPARSQRPRGIDTRTLKRPNTIALAASKGGTRLGAYSFGDLYLFDLETGPRLKLLCTIKDVLYINKDAYIREGRIDLSSDGRWLAFSGRGQYVRIVDTRSGAIRNVSLKFNAVRAWSHALPGRGRFVSTAFEPKPGGGLWISTFSLFGEYGPRLKARRFFTITKGQVHETPLEDIEPDADHWDVQKLVVTKRSIVVMAEGRALVLDRATMKLRGWIGARANVDLGNALRNPWLRRR